jgi:hypothetical protein
MKKTLLVDADVFSHAEPLEKLPKVLRKKKRVLNLATVLNADRQCGTTFTSRMGANDGELRSAEEICSWCSIENVSSSAYPPGYLVGRKILEFFGFDRYATIDWEPIWNSRESN